MWDSDINNPDVFKRFDAQSVNVNPHSTTYTTFDVNFRSPDLSRGDFKTWVQNKNDTSIWDNAWYRATISPLLGKASHLRIMKGILNYASLSLNL